MAATKKKVYEVINATDRTLKSITVGGHTVKFNPNGQAMVADAGIAAEVNKRYGWKARGRDAGQVVVTELEAYNEYRDRSVRRVNYLTVPALPWHRYDASGKRIK